MDQTVKMILWACDFIYEGGAHKDLSTSLPTDWWALGEPNSIVYFTCVNSMFGLPSLEHPCKSIMGPTDQWGESKDLDRPIIGPGGGRGQRSL